MHLRLALLCANIAAYGTQAFLAETARPGVEGALRRLARRRAAGLFIIADTDGRKVLRELSFNANS